MKTLYLLIAFCIGIFLLFVSGASQPQQPNPTSQEPKTKLESFQRQTGAVVIKGYSEIGSMTASGTGSLSVDCIELTDVAKGKHQMGILIEVREVGRIGNSDRTFVDYEEIEDMLKGIDYISNVEPNATKLDNFEAIYTTKSDFRVTTFSSSGKIDAAIDGGHFSSTHVFISLQELSELRKLISKAKAKLDSIR